MNWLLHTAIFLPASAAIFLISWFEFALLYGGAETSTEKTKKVTIPGWKILVVMLTAPPSLGAILLGVLWVEISMFGNTEAIVMLIALLLVVGVALFWAHKKYRDQIQSTESE